VTLASTLARPPKGTADAPIRAVGSECTFWMLVPAGATFYPAAVCQGPGCPEQAGQALRHSVVTLEPGQNKTVGFLLWGQTAF
jgi:hypothetical protein